VNRDTLQREMHGKVVVITGATSGIGQVTAEALAAAGARIVQVARDRQRGEAARRRLSEIGPAAVHSIHYADLQELDEMKRVAAEIAASESHIDVLINNAGAVFGSRRLTRDALERTFALNHVAYFVLTHVLWERLVASAPARIVNTASEAHRRAVLDFDDLQSERAFRPSVYQMLRHGGPGFGVYARSKLCNVLFTRELARHLAGSGVTANSIHPGFTATRFGDESGGFQSLAIRLAKHFAISAEAGAETLTYVASASEVAGVTGQYFSKCRSTTPSAAARDDQSARRLWIETAHLAGLSSREGTHPIG
jgi:NAD(P)-dependent dehydrogenase (short-subunit alcohol dehydrogenase family)